MIGLKHISITPQIMSRTCDIDGFKGLWIGLEKHTTALGLLHEVRTYRGDFQKVLIPLKDKPISPDIIRILHGKYVMRSPAPSEYKSEENRLNVENADGVPVGYLDTAAPEEVEPLMAKLCEWLNAALEAEDGQWHPLIIIAVFAAVFLQISPFEKGNERVLYFLIMLLLLKAGYSYAPYVPIDSVMAEQAGQWFRALKANQASLEAGKPDWAPWLEAFLALLQAQKHKLEDRLENKQEDLSRLPTLSAQIMALFEEHQRLQMKEIIKLTGGRRSTIKLRLSEMLEQGLLTRTGNARATFYSLVSGE